MTEHICKPRSGEFADIDPAEMDRIELASRASFSAPARNLMVSSYEP